MATYIEDTGFPKAPRHPTLENVAEEMLNGMFCHYEEPAEVYRKGGILRNKYHSQRRKKNKTKNNSHPDSKAIRWADHKGKANNRSYNTMYGREEYDDDMMQDYSCGILDASVRAGCISANRKEDLVDFFVPLRRKSRARKNLVFDDEGNPVIVGPDGTIIETPPTPPPSRREMFIPELCGVRINCADDESHLAELARTEAQVRAAQFYDDMMDDATNSLVDDGDSEKGGSHKRKSAKLKALRKGLRPQDDWEDTDDVVNERFQTGPHIPSSAKDPIELMREENDGLIASNAPSARLGRRKSIDNSDWDETLPIAPGDSSVERKSRWSILGRNKREPSPGRNKGRGRSKSPGTKESKLPSRSALESRAHSANQEETLPHPGLHPAHPLNQYPYLRAHLQAEGPQEEDVFEKQSLISAHRRNFDGPTQQVLNDDQLERQSYITAYRQGFVGAVPPPPSRVDDRIEKQSFITDHRNMFDTNKTMAAASAASTGINRGGITGFNSGADLARLKMRQMAEEPSADKAETRSMIMTPAGMLPTPPRQPRQSQGRSIMPRIHESASQQSMDPPKILGTKSNEPELAKKEEDEATWEQRTREAWERLRSGFGFSSEENKEESNAEILKNDDDEVSHTAGSLSSRSSHSVSSHKRPAGILKQSSYERRVSFGPVEERTFIDDSDENVPVPSSMSEPVITPMHVPEEEPDSIHAPTWTAPVVQPDYFASPPAISHSYSYSSQGTSPSKKTKRVFRGTKLIKNILGKSHGRRNSYASGEQMTGMGEIEVLRVVNRPGQQAPASS